MPYSDASIVASGRKEFVGRVKSNAFYVTAMLRDSLELLEVVSRPHDDLRVQANRNEDRRITGPSKVLHVVLMPVQSAKDAPILHGRCFC